MSPAESRRPGWLDPPAAVAAGGAPLVCFPYAGGGASVFRDWPAVLAGVARVVPVLLPGRGPRGAEPPRTAIVPMAAEVAAALVAGGWTDAGACAFFGHSMGALLAYEVACALRAAGRPGPVHLFVAGSRAPHLYGERADRRRSDEEVRRLAEELGGAGDGRDEAGRALLERGLPVLRADLRACETYRWLPRPPLDCRVTAFSGTADPVATAGQTEAWRTYTTGPFRHRRLPGGHFFPFRAPGAARTRLVRELWAVLASARPPVGGGLRPVRTG